MSGIPKSDSGTAADQAGKADQSTAAGQTDQINVSISFSQFQGPSQNDGVIVIAPITALGRACLVAIFVFLALWFGAVFVEYMSLRPEPNFLDVLFADRPLTGILVAVSAFVGLLDFIYSLTVRRWLDGAKSGAKKDSKSPTTKAGKISFRSDQTGIKMLDQGAEVDEIGWERVRLLYIENKPESLTPYITKLEKKGAESPAFIKFARTLVPIRKDLKGRRSGGNGIHIRLNNPVGGDDAGKMKRRNRKLKGRRDEVIIPSSYFRSGLKRYSRDRFLEDCMHDRTNYYLANGK